MKRFIVRFSGNVQGVGFRMTCITEAAELDIHGFVRNETDGSVLMDIDASAKDANELLRRIQEARRGYLDNTFTEECESQGRTDGLRIAH